jgi:hypothetical protein
MPSTTLKATRLRPRAMPFRAYRDLVVGHAREAVGGDHRHRREDPPDEVGTAGGGVLVGRREQRPEREVDGVVAGQVLPPGGLDPVAGVDAAGTVGLEVGFLVLAAGDVVAEHPAAVATVVVPGEQGHHREALHRRGEVRAHHLSELVGLALERERLPLDLLVVLELHLEEAHHLHRGAGGPGDGDAGEVVGREDLLDPATGDRVPGGGAPVARHHHAPGEADGEDGGAVGDVERRSTPRALQAGTGEIVRRDTTQEVDEGRAGIEARREGGKRRLGHPGEPIRGLRVPCRSGQYRSARRSARGRPSGSFTTRETACAHQR